MSNNTATIKTRKKFSFYKNDNNDSSTGSYIICVGIFRVSGSFESIICTNGSVRFTCTDWGVAFGPVTGVMIELIKIYYSFCQHQQEELVNLPIS